MATRKWKKVLKNHWVKFAIFLGIFTLLTFSAGFAWRFYTPKLKSWALIEIESLSQKHLPVRVWPQRVDLQLFPLGLVFEDLRLLPKDELKAQLAPSHVERLHVHLSLWALLQGRLHLSELIIHRPEIKVIFKENIFSRERLQQQSVDVPREFPLKELLNAPLDAIRVENLDLMIGVREKDAAAWVRNLNLMVENRFEALLLDLQVPKVSLKNVAIDKLVTLKLDTRVLVEEKRVQVSSFSLKKDQSWLIGTGEIRGSTSKLEFTEQDYELRSQLQLEELRSYLDVFAPQWTLPEVAGRSQLDLKVSHVPNELPRIDFNTKLENARIDQFYIGDLTTSGRFISKTLTLEKTKIQNRSGQLQATDLEFHFADKLTFKGVAQVNRLEVRTFLETLGLPTIPVHLDLKGHLPCQGEIQPTLNVTCTGSATGENLWVHTGKKEKKTIVKLEPFQANGSVTVSSTEVKYQADLQLGEKSKGSSKGSISYKKGFDISYKADSLHMTDVKDLAGLDIEGVAQLSGTTKGNSDAASLSMSVKGKEMWLKDFGLGQGEFDARYLKGILTFRNIHGSYGTSRYNGNLSINLRKDQIYLAAQVPYLDLSDLQSLFSRKMDLPLKITGTGSGDLKVWGPLEFNRLSYELNSSFFRGSVADESFDEFVFRVSSVDGHVRSKRVQLLKDSSQIDLNGQIWPDGKIDAVVVGRGLRLEDSEHLNRLGLNVGGNLDFTMSLSDHLPQPETELNGRLSNMTLGGQPAEDSKFALSFDRDGVEGSGQFIGKVVETRFHFPFHPQAPFRFYLKADRWNFAQIFSLFYEASRQNEFQTALSTTVDLKSSYGGFWNSSGQIQVNTLEVSRGALKMAAPKPMTIQVQDGVFTTHNWYLEGPSSFLRLEAQHASKENLKASLNGKLNLSLLALLTPFLHELRGQLSLSMNFSGSVAAPQILGSAYVEEGFIKLKEFPHAFEEIRADVLFNRQNILLNSLKARMAGGNLTADGSIRLVDVDKIPINIKGQFSGVSLNVPENIRTQGSGQLYFKGDWFPYTLGGTYNVTYGDISKEFVATGSSGGSRSIQPSTYLPKFLSRENFQPITLDLKVNLRNPVMVKNSIIEAPVKGELRVRGLPQSPRLQGSISATSGGQITFRDNEFEILTAHVEYANSAPENPNLYVSAQTRVTEHGQEEDDQVYDISLIAQGSAQDPQLTLSSQPVLNENEIISLLALGLTSSELDKRNNLDAQAQQSSIQIGSAILQKPLSKEIKKRTGWDFQLSSSYNDSENASVPKVTLSKQWSPEFGASASRTLEKNPTNNVKLEYKINRNLSVIGSWEAKEETQIDEEKDTSQSRMGLDLEYKIEFK